MSNGREGSIFGARAVVCIDNAEFPQVAAGTVPDYRAHGLELITKKV
jgi:hypothetical protein